jgi:hypothetical protein
VYYNEKRGHCKEIQKISYSFTRPQKTTIILQVQLAARRGKLQYQKHAKKK